MRTGMLSAALVALVNAQMTCQRSSRVEPLQVQGGEVSPVKTQQGSELRGGNFPRNVNRISASATSSVFEQKGMVSSLVLDNGADANQYNPFRIDIKSPPEHKFGNWDGNKMAEVQISMSVNNPLTGNQQEKASAVLSIFFTSEPAKADAPNEDNSVLANAMDSASQLDLHGLINSGNIKKHSVYTEKFTDAGTECQGKTLSWILLNNNDGIQRASAEQIAAIQGASTAAPLKRASEISAIQLVDNIGASGASFVGTAAAMTTASLIALSIF